MFNTRVKNHILVAVNMMEPKLIMILLNVQELFLLKDQYPKQ
jgi:hypothetical protein